MIISQAIIEADSKADFCLKIDYVRGSRNPARVFRAMSDLIEACESIDHSLIKSIDSKIEPILLLEDVNTGSIKAWLREIVESAEDDHLKQLEWKPIVGRYLVKAKYYFIDFLRERTEITNISDVVELERGLQRLAEETDVRRLPAYRPVERSTLLENINNLNKALAPLEEGDTASYITEDIEVPFNLRLSIAPETIDALVTSRILTSQVPAILKIKKAEFLTEARWEFKHGDMTISAKIFDAAWLTEYQSGALPLVPGDALHVTLRTEAKYDHEGNLIGTKHDIINVLEIIHGHPEEQATLTLVQ